MEASLSAQRREGLADADPVLKVWYRRALGGLYRWRQRAAVEARERAPLWRSSLKAVGAALARVACICKPACSGFHADALAPTTTMRRRGRKQATKDMPAVSMPAGEWDNWRCVLLGMSPTLDDDVLMRRLVLEEEYATRRRVEMQAAAKRSGRFWFPPGPSRLSQMSLADDDDDLCGEGRAGESSSSTSSQRSEDQ